MVELKSPQEVEVAQNIEKILRDHPDLRAIYNDPKLSPFQKKLRVRGILKAARSEITKEQKALATTKEQLAWCESVMEASKGFPEWEKLPPKLEKNDCSRLHHLVTDLKISKKLMGDKMKGDDVDSIEWEKMTPFVVQHDWASAFQNAGDYADGVFNLPYEMCAFEFRITGRSVTMLAFQTEGCAPSFQVYVQFGNYWVSHDEAENYPAKLFAMQQVKAICVALDAEVATRTMVRAPEKLNRKRQGEGKLPLYSYHIVNLNRRYRAANPSAGGGSSLGKKRLHFRRGHWRHYAEFKTWIKWTLVGNPELGFIDKEYRL